MSNRCINFTVTEKFFFKNLPGTQGPLHSEAPWTLPILPTPLLRHCAQTPSPYRLALRALAIVCPMLILDPHLFGSPVWSTVQMLHCRTRTATMLMTNVLFVLIIAPL